VAQKDESLIGEMREQLRGDRERAASRTTTRRDVATGPQPAVPSPRLGVRLRALLGRR